MSNPFRECSNSVANADCEGPQRLAAVGGSGVVVRRRGDGEEEGGRLLTHIFV